MNASKASSNDNGKSSYRDMSRNSSEQQLGNKTVLQRDGSTNKLLKP